MLIKTIENKNKQLHEKLVVTELKKEKLREEYDEALLEAGTLALDKITRELCSVQPMKADVGLSYRIRHSDGKITST